MSEIPKRLERIYQDATSHIVLLKQQQWKIITNAMTAYAVLFGGATALATKADIGAIRWALMMAVAVVFLAAATVLHTIVPSLARSRERINWIHKNCFHAFERQELLLLERDNWFSRRGYIDLLIFICFFAGALAMWAIWIVSSSALGGRVLIN